MIVTVSLNTAIQQTLRIPEFDKNRTLRATAITQNLGGSGSIAAWYAGYQGLHCTAFGFKAGTLGNLTEEMLHQHNVITNFIATEGSTSLNTVVLSEENDSHAIISTATLSVTQAHLDQLKQQLQDAMADASCLVIDSTVVSGVTVDFLVALVQIANEADVPVICSANKTTLAALLDVQPDYLLADEFALSQHTGQDLESLEALKKIPIQSVILLQKNGLIAKFDSEIYQNSQLEVLSSLRREAMIGCLLGSLAEAIEQNTSITDGLLRGIAAGLALQNQNPLDEYDLATMPKTLQQVELDKI